MFAEIILPYITILKINWDSVFKSNQHIAWPMKRSQYIQIVTKHIIHIHKYVVLCTKWFSELWKQVIISQVQFWHIVHHVCFQNIENLIAINALYVME